MAIQSKSKLGINVGVDVGKSKLDFCIHEHQLHWQEEDNNPEGIKHALKRLSHYKVERFSASPENERKRVSKLE